MNNGNSNNSGDYRFAQNLAFLSSTIGLWQFLQLEYQYNLEKSNLELIVLPQLLIVYQIKLPHKILVF